MTVAVVLAVSCGAVAQSAEQQLKKLENDWAEAAVKKNITVFQRMMSEDYTNTAPSGNVFTKAQEIAMLKSGDYVVSAYTLSDMKVRLYGDSAVVTFMEYEQEIFKGKDVSGTNRWTDTWVKRGDSWQCVASHGSKVVKPN